MSKPKIISISLPEYTIQNKPDYWLGFKVDDVLKNEFDMDNIVIRAISLHDHSYPIDELIKIILEKGTDKYDPNRKGVSHEEFEPYNADFQGATWEIDKETSSMFADIMRNFYENAPLDRGYPLRIDLLLIYDSKQVVQAKKINKDSPSINPKLEKYLFKFRNPKNKQKALLGIVKILR